MVRPLNLCRLSSLSTTFLLQPLCKSFTTDIHMYSCMTMCDVPDNVISCIVIYRILNFDL